MANAFHVDEARLKAVALANHLDLIVLFGSHAKQRAVTGQSDLDVAVHFAIGKYQRGKSHSKLYAALAAVLQPVAELDLTILNSAGPLLLFEVARSGIALYQETPATFTMFKVSAGRVYDDSQKFFAARERYMKAKYSG